jgi:hypothetical protein
LILRIDLPLVAGHPDSTNKCSLERRVFFSQAVCESITDGLVATPVVKDLELIFREKYMAGYAFQNLVVTTQVGHLVWVHILVMLKAWPEMRYKLL